MIRPVENPFPGLSEIVPRAKYLPMVASTNQYLTEEWHHFSDYGVVFSLNQTDGRGRKGRTWVSVPGETLCLSILVPISGQSRNAESLPLIAGASLLDTLRTLGLGDAEMKWPNDILVGKRKIAGILCEVISSTYAVVGIGVNLTSIPGDLAEENVCSLKDFGLGLHEEIAPLLGHLVRLLSNRWSDASTLVESQTWEQFFSTRLGTLGRKIQITLDDGSSWSGLASGLDSMGRLLVIPEGETIARALSSGDVRHLRA
jgi:BirA family transcriptional regulator, biotin operon repressor / biotin---[acetyl-CoA-carboxylase] ligase